jgi:hypothetical protein
MKVRVIDMDMRDLLREAQAIPGVYRANIRGTPLGEDEQKEYKTQAKSKLKKKKKKTTTKKGSSLSTELMKLAKQDPEFGRALIQELRERSAGFVPRRQKIKYPGIFGNAEATKSILKGYLNLGLADPSQISTKTAHLVAGWVGSQLMRDQKAFLLDPEGIFKKLFRNDAQAAEQFKRVAISEIEEQLSYDYESEDYEAIDRNHKFIKELEKKRIQIKPVMGKLGPGYKITW